MIPNTDHYHFNSGRKAHEKYMKKPRTDIRAHACTQSNIHVQNVAQIFTRLAVPNILCCSLDEMTNTARLIYITASINGNLVSIITAPPLCVCVFDRASRHELIAYGRRPVHKQQINVATRRRRLIDWINSRRASVYTKPRTIAQGQNRPNRPVVYVDPLRRTSICCLLCGRRPGRGTGPDGVDGESRSKNATN